ncbi:hypothetical protein POSPLADRAFT_1136678, partial [Postia placenta MAD-698-R-SB12]
LDHTQSVLLPSLGEPLTLALSTCGAFVFSLPLYMLRHVMVHVPSASHAVSFGTLAVLAFLAYTLLFQAPKASRLFQSSTLPPQYVIGSYIASLLTSVALGILVYGKYPRLTDLIVGSLLLYGVYPRPINSVSVSPYASSSRLVRSYLKTILSNPESRKIFYFLVLNMCYMLVQMVYGVWTNSLGLISDAIHMAFDCMAIGVGLIASVMARWPPNERFTYGYGRIETLSGFANGIFLILISVFIVFEAIQRLLEPPEMNTSQLLLVSSLGLGVNLFGMFAMGGHHHDTLGSVGVIVSTLLIQWYGWTGFDPIASLFIAVLIAASVIPLVIDTGKVLALDLSDREARIRDTLSEVKQCSGMIRTVLNN